MKWGSENKIRENNGTIEKKNDSIDESDNFSRSFHCLFIFDRVFWDWMLEIFRLLSSSAVFSSHMFMEVFKRVFFRVDHAWLAKQNNNWIRSIQNEFSNENAMNSISMRANEKLAFFGTGI